MHRIRPLATFSNIFGSASHLQLEQGDAVRGVYRSGKRWVLKWQGRGISLPEVSKKNQLIPGGLGVFCAYRDRFSHVTKTSDSATTLSNLVQLDKTSCDDMMLACAFVLSGMCRFIHRQGQIYLQATGNAVGRSKVNRLHQLINCPPDRLIYEFLLQSMPLPEGFIHNILTPYYVKQLVRKKKETLRKSGASDRYINDRKLKISAENLIKQALLAASINVNDPKVQQDQLLLFKSFLKYHPLKYKKSAGKSDHIPPAEPFSSLSAEGQLFADSLRLKVDNSTYLDATDKWYCEQVAERQVNSYASKALACALKIRQWALRNKRSALVNFVDIIIGSIISAALSGGIFGLIFILATICSVTFWFVVDCCTLHVQSIYHRSKLAQLSENRQVSDIRDIRDWGITSEKMDVTAVDKAVEELKALTRSGAFLSACSGFTDMYNALKNIEREQAHIIAIKGKASEDSEHAISYQIARAILEKREKEFETAGENVEKFLVGTIQSFTAVQSEYEKTFSELWSGIESMDEETLRNLFLESVDKMAGNNDPFITKAKKFLFNPAPLEQLVTQHLKACNLDKEQMLRELAAGISLSDVLQTEAEQKKQAYDIESALNHSSNLLPGRIWRLFSPNRRKEKDLHQIRVVNPDNLSGNKRQQSIKRHLSEGIWQGSRVVQRYTTDYIKRIPHRMIELLIDAGIYSPHRSLLSAKNVARQAVPNPVAGFGIGILAWGIVKITASLLSKKNDSDNEKTTEKRRQFSHSQRYDSGYEETDASGVMGESELQALRQKGKDGATVIGRELELFLELKPQLDLLKKRIAAGEQSTFIREEIARTFLTYQLLNHDIEHKINSTSGLTYHEMIRYKTLMKNRATHVSPE